MLIKQAIFARSSCKQELSKIGSSISCRLYFIACQVKRIASSYQLGLGWHILKLHIYSCRYVLTCRYKHLEKKQNSPKVWMVSWSYFNPLSWTFEPTLTSGTLVGQDSKPVPDSRSRMLRISELLPAGSSSEPSF